MIMGCSGAGKSTLARELHQLTQLEVIHLDQYYWKSNWIESEKAEWEKVVRILAQKEEWIMDGNYSSTMDIRVERADTLIYLDYPTLTCLWRITKRILQYYGQERPDMPLGCPERFDLEFYHYVATYNLTRRKKMLNRLKELPAEKAVFMLRNDGEVQQFLEKKRKIF